MQPAVPMQAFAESGKSLSIPGPLIRVTAGTDVELHMRNSIPGTVLTVHGLFDRPAYHDRPVMVPYGSARVVRFRAGAPGTRTGELPVVGKAADSRYLITRRLEQAVRSQSSLTGPSPRR